MRQPAKWALVAAVSTGLSVLGAAQRGGADDLASPLLPFSTLLGGTSSEIASSAVFGPDGMLWITASSTSTDFAGAPRGSFTGGGEDIVVLRFDTAAHRVVSSLWIGGPGEDDCVSLVFDADGNPFIAGRTNGGIEATHTIGTPVTDPEHEHEFVARLTKDATATEWVTLLGQSPTMRLNAIAALPGGDVVIAGGYAGDDFPLVHPIRTSGGTGFVARMRSDGTDFVWSTRMGNWASSLGVGDDGTIVVGGYANPDEFPRAVRLFGEPSELASEGSVIELDAEGTTVRRVVLVGDTIVTQVVPRADGLVVVGSTRVDDFPAPAAQHGAPGEAGDAFLMRLDPESWSVARAALLGGSDGEYLAMSPAPGGLLWVAGTTWSQDMPLLAPIQPFSAGGEDGYVAALSAEDFSLRFATYLGGDRREFPGGVAAAPDGSVWFLGATWSSNFPLHDSIQGSATASSYDVFAAHVIAGDAAAVPAVPTALAADVSDGRTIRLTWQPGSANETGFAVFRRERSAFARVDSVAAGVTNWTDTNVLADRHYSYAVQAFNGAGGSTASVTAETQVPVSLDVVVTSGSVRFIRANPAGISELQLTGTIQPNALSRSGEFDPRRDGFLWMLPNSPFGDAVLLEVASGAGGWKTTRHGVRWAGAGGLRFTYDQPTGRFALRVRSSGMGTWARGATLFLASGLDAGEVTPVWRPRGRNGLRTP